MCSLEHQNIYGGKLKSIFFLFALSLFLLTSISFSSPISPSLTPEENPNSLSLQVRTRIREQLILIVQGLKSGKLTNRQAQTLRKGLDALHEKEKSYRKQNRNDELTASQQAEINNSLNKNSKRLGETPVSSKP
jgi:hypothetical protein